MKWRRGVVLLTALGALWGCDAEVSREIIRAERVVELDEVELWTEAFGNREDPAVLMSHGGTAQGILWPDEFCESLARVGRFVIRYDHRDTGQSTTFTFSEDPYDLDDLTLDAVGILDAYGIERAHVVGFSMGGWIVQRMAIDHPQRVRTMTSITSTPVGGAAAPIDPSLEPLEPRDPEVQAGLQRLMAGPAADREDEIERQVEVFRLLTGSLEPFDDAHYRALATRVYDRARDWPARMNHMAAIATAVDRRPELAGVTVPTLVIHGVEDRLAPLSHAEAVAETVPGARLLKIERMGHELARAAWPRIVEAIAAHTAGP